MENSVNISDLVNSLGSLNKINSNVNLRKTIEEVLIPILRNKYGRDASFGVIANADRGDFEVIRNYEVVEEVKGGSSANEISIDDERLEGLDFEVEETYVEVVNLSELTPNELMSLRTSLNNKVNQLMLSQLDSKFGDLNGKVMKFKVEKSVRGKFILTSSEGYEFELPFENKIQKEIVAVGSEIYALVVETGIKNVVTRKTPEFVRGLFEIISDKIIECEVVDVVRRPGVQSKIAIKIDSYKGVFDDFKFLSANLSSELNLETVDIIIYSSDPSKYLRNCFFNSWIIDAWVADGRGNLLIDKNQIPFVIGNHGVNIKLTEKLMGMQIDLHISKVNSQEDIELSEFTEEIGADFIDKLEGINFTMARELMKSDKMRLPKFINKKKLIKLMDLIHEEFTKE